MMPGIGWDRLFGDHFKALVGPVVDEVAGQFAFFKNHVVTTKGVGIVHLGNHSAGSRLVWKDPRRNGKSLIRFKGTCLTSLDIAITREIKSPPKPTFCRFQFPFTRALNTLCD